MTDSLPIAAALVAGFFLIAGALYMKPNDFQACYNKAMSIYGDITTAGLAAGGEEISLKTCASR